MRKEHLNIGVDVIIQDSEGKILLQRRVDDQSWSMPGGWVEAHETPDQAAIREVQEETGLTIQLECLAHVHVRESGTVHLTYLGYNPLGSLRKSEEGLEVAYKSLDEVDKWHTDHLHRITEALGV